MERKDLMAYIDVLSDDEVLQLWPNLSKDSTSHNERAKFLRILLNHTRTKQEAFLVAVRLLQNRETSSRMGVLFLSELHLALCQNFRQRSRISLVESSSCNNVDKRGFNYYKLAECVLAPSLLEEMDSNDDAESTTKDLRCLDLFPTLLSTAHDAVCPSRVERNCRAQLQRSSPANEFREVTLGRLLLSKWKPCAFLPLFALLSEEMSSFLSELKVRNESTDEKSEISERRQNDDISYQTGWDLLRRQLLCAVNTRNTGYQLEAADFAGLLRMTLSATENAIREEKSNSSTKNNFSSSTFQNSECFSWFEVVQILLKQVPAASWPTVSFVLLLALRQSINLRKFVFLFLQSKIQSVKKFTWQDVLFSLLALSASEDSPLAFAEMRTRERRVAIVGLIFQSATKNQNGELDLIEKVNKITENLIICGGAESATVLLRLCCNWIEDENDFSVNEFYPQSSCFENSGEQNQNFFLPFCSFHVLIQLFTKETAVRSQLLRSIFSAIAESSRSKNKSNTLIPLYCTLLGQLCRNKHSIQFMAENSSQLIEWLGYLRCFDVSTTLRLLHALQPVVGSSPSFANALVMFLRKKLVGRQPDQQRVAIGGFCLLLSPKSMASIEIQKEAFACLQTCFSFSVPLRAFLYDTLVEVSIGNRNQCCKCSALSSRSSSSSSSSSSCSDGFSFSQFSQTQHCEEYHCPLCRSKFFLANFARILIERLSRLFTEVWVNSHSPIDLFFSNLLKNCTENFNGIGKMENSNSLSSLELRIERCFEIVEIKQKQHDIANRDANEYDNGKSNNSTKGKGKYSGKKRRKNPSHQNISKVKVRPREAVARLFLCITKLVTDLNLFRSDENDGVEKTKYEKLFFSIFSSLVRILQNPKEIARLLLPVHVRESIENDDDDDDEYSDNSKYFYGGANGTLKLRECRQVPMEERISLLISLHVPLAQILSSEKFISFLLQKRNPKLNVNRGSFIQISSKLYNRYSMFCASLPDSVLCRNDANGRGFSFDVCSSTYETTSSDNEIEKKRKDEAKLIVDEGENKNLLSYHQHHILYPFQTFTNALMIIQSYIENFHSKHSKEISLGANASPLFICDTLQTIRHWISLDIRGLSRNQNVLQQSDVKRLWDIFKDLLSLSSVAWKNCGEEDNDEDHGAEIVEGDVLQKSNPKQVTTSLNTTLQDSFESFGGLQVSEASQRFAHGAEYARYAQRVSSSDKYISSASTFIYRSPLLSKSRRAMKSLSSDLLARWWELRESILNTLFTLMKWTDCFLIQMKSTILYRNEENLVNFIEQRTSVALEVAKYLENGLHSGLPMSLVASHMKFLESIVNSHNKNINQISELSKMMKSILCTHAVSHSPTLRRILSFALQHAKAVSIPLAVNWTIETILSAINATQLDEKTCMKLSSSMTCRSTALSVAFSILESVISNWQAGENRKENGEILSSISKMFLTIYRITESIFSSKPKSVKPKRLEGESNKENGANEIRRNKRKRRISLTNGKSKKMNGEDDEWLPDANTEEINEKNDTILKIDEKTENGAKNILKKFLSRFLRLNGRILQRAIKEASLQTLPRRHPKSSIAWTEKQWIVLLQLRKSLVNLFDGKSKNNQLKRYRSILSTIPGCTRLIPGLRATTERFDLAMVKVSNTIVFPNCEDEERLSFVEEIESLLQSTSNSSTINETNVEELNHFKNSSTGKRKRLRSRNKYIDKWLVQEDGTDSYADMADWIVTGEDNDHDSENSENSEDDLSSSFETGKRHGDDEEEIIYSDSATETESESEIES
eukprot:g1625.t1